MNGKNEEGRGSSYHTAPHCPGQKAGCVKKENRKEIYINEVIFKFLMKIKKVLDSLLRSVETAEM